VERIYLTHDRVQWRDESSGSIGGKFIGWWAAINVPKARMLIFLYNKKTLKMCVIDIIHQRSKQWTLHKKLNICDTGRSDNYASCKISATQTHLGASPRINKCFWHTKNRVLPDACSFTRLHSHSKPKQNKTCVAFLKTFWMQKARE
jgi:hypothetical protein